MQNAHGSHIHTELAKFRCAHRLNPAGIDTIVLTLKSTGHFPLNTDKIITEQACGPGDNTQQLSWNGCAEV